MSFFGSRTCDTFAKDSIMETPRALRSTYLFKGQSHTGAFSGVLLRYLSPPWTGISTDGRPLWARYRSNGMGLEK